MSTKSSPDVLELPEITEEEQSLLHLILWNDDFNDIDFVVESVSLICEIGLEQAEQCAFIAHTKGKYCIKEGTREKLESLDRRFAELGITTSVE